MSKHLRIFVRTGSYIDTESLELVDLAAALVPTATGVACVRPLDEGVSLEYGGEMRKRVGRSIVVLNRRTQNPVLIPIDSISHAEEFED